MDVQNRRSFDRARPGVGSDGDGASNGGCGCGRLCSPLPAGRVDHTARDIAVVIRRGLVWASTVGPASGVSGRRRGMTTRHVNRAQAGAPDRS